MPPIKDAESEFFRKEARVFTTRPTIDTNAYANGDTVGGLQTLLDAVNYDELGGYIHSITVIDETGTPTDGFFVFFSEDPGDSTFTDNAALAIHANDRDKILGFVPVTTEDYFPIGGVYVASLRGIGLTFQLTTSNQNLYVAYVATEAATYSGANDLIFKYGVAQG